MSRTCFAEFTKQDIIMFQHLHTFKMLIIMIKFFALNVVCQLQPASTQQLRDCNWQRSNNFKPLAVREMVDGNRIYLTVYEKNSKLRPFVHPYGSTIKCHDQCSTKPIAKMMSGHGALDGCITLCVMANPQRCIPWHDAEPNHFLQSMKSLKISPCVYPYGSTIK